MVTISTTPNCTCPYSTIPINNTKQICKHIIWIYINIYKLQESNSIMHQIGLTKSERDTLFSLKSHCQFSDTSNTRPDSPGAPSTSTTPNTTFQPTPPRKTPQPTTPGAHSTSTTPNKTFQPTPPRKTPQPTNLTNLEMSGLFAAHPQHSEQQTWWVSKRKTNVNANCAGCRKSKMELGRIHIFVIIHK